MDWIHRATHSRIKPSLVDFGKNLRGYVQGIIAAADFKINTSVLEGVNNKITAPSAFTSTAYVHLSFSSTASPTIYMLCRP